MTEYISTYITGFDNIVRANLIKDLLGCKIMNVYDGLIHYKYNGNRKIIEKLPYLNNTFFLIKKFKNIHFNQMIEQICVKKINLPITTGSFRIRFSKGNQFAKVDSKYIKKIENFIIHNSRMHLDRVNPNSEIWFIIRDDGNAFCGQLIFKRKITEKNLSQGELRPEFAYLMCLCTKLKRDWVVYDPFCGYGGIVKQLASVFKMKNVIASDIDERKLNKIKNYKGIKCFKADALNTDKINSNSIDVIITDPPWGYYEQIEDISSFYSDMMTEMKRIIKNDGVMIVLSARKEEFISVCEKQDMEIMERIDTLVNGKKAAVFIMKK